MLDAALARLRGLRRLHRHRDVSRERHASPPRLLGQREEGVPGHGVVDLDQIDAELLEAGDGRPRPLRIRDGQPVRDIGFGTVDGGTRTEDARPHELSLVDAGAPSFQDVQLAAHVPHGRDPVGDQHPESRLVAVGHVSVSVPESGDEEPPASLHHLSARRRLQRGRVSDLLNDSGAHQHRRVRAGRRSRAVDQDDVLQEERRSAGRTVGPGGSTCAGAEREAEHERGCCPVIDHGSSFVPAVRNDGAAPILEL
ncbi:MAG TPA: hypothetical protein VF756_20545 [Thermoanaerobaculia bacterium]